jgi:hypothetical protein
MMIRRGNWPTPRFVMKHAFLLCSVVILATTLLAGCGSDPVKPTTLPPSQVTVDWEQPFPPAPIYEIVGFSSSDIYGVGGGGMILHYNGVTWSPVESPTREDLTSMSKAGDQLVAVGRNGTIVRFDGSTWRTEPSGTSAYLLSVWGNAPDTLYATGDHGTVLRYDGTQWNALIAPPSQLLRCSWGTTADNYYVGADSLFHFDGRQWTNTGIVPQNGIWSIWGASREDIWASDGTNWLWHYDGNSWKKVLSSMSYPFIDLWGLAADDVFGIGGFGVVSHYDGVNWSEEWLGDYSLMAQWGTSKDDRWVSGLLTQSMGPAGALFHFDGNEWTRTGQVLSARLGDIWSDSNGDQAIAVGYAGDILEKSNHAWHVVTPVTSQTLNAVWSLPNGDAIAVGENGTCVRRSGETWAPVDLGTSETFADVWGSSNSDIYLASSKGVWHFDGTSWLKPDVMDDAYYVWGSGPANVFVSGTDFIHGVVRQFDGSSWKTIYSDENTTARFLTGYANGNVFAVFVEDGSPQPEHIRKYDGHEWTEVTPPQLNYFYTLAACENFGLVTSGAVIEGKAIVHPTVLHLRDGTWTALDTKYSSRFGKAWGFDGGVYLLGFASIVRCHY